MPNNYVLLDRIELNNTAASVTFDNIPQSGYTDLKVVFSVRDTSAGLSNNIILRLNSVTTSQSVRSLQGNGSSVVSFSDTPIYTGGAVGNTATANTFSNCEMYITNYSSTTQNKSVSIDAVTEHNGTAAIAALNAGLYASNTAISSIQFAPNGAVSFMAGSTFSLYGLAQVGTTPAIAPKADGGNVIGTDGTYWYHAFLANGTFTPTQSISADYLVVAGGGGGGGFVGGGGGAGGYRTAASFDVTPGNTVTVTVGAGGAGSAAGTGDRGTNGSNSIFSTITSTGGGGGGDSNGTVEGINGGSGGGGSAGSQGSAPSTGVSGQGNNGGLGFSGSGGGGGGANAVGADASSFGAGAAGGNGLSSSITGTAVFYAGGGGGGGSPFGTGNGAGGLGGGGGGGAGASTGTPGTANTGGGGGGAGSGSSGGTGGGAGGSGIVIIRYLVA